MLRELWTLSQAKKQPRSTLLKPYERLQRHWIATGAGIGTVASSGTAFYSRTTLESIFFIRAAETSTTTR
jgi:hypothetical protein